MECDMAETIPEASVVENFEDDSNVPISTVINENDTEEGSIQVALPTAIGDVSIESNTSLTHFLRRKQHPEYIIVKDFTFINFLISIFYLHITIVGYVFIIICLQGLYATNLGKRYSLKIYKECIVFQLFVRIMLLPGEIFTQIVRNTLL